jgi:putative spermidine/putrescine transport system permease protein
LTLPIVVPTIVYAVGAYLVSLQLDLVGSDLLLMCAHAVLALPFVLLNVMAGLRTIDHRLELVAQSLGAKPWTSFRTVTLPLIAPALLASALITLILSLDETVVALFLTNDTRPTLPVKVYNSIRYDLNPVVPAAAAIVLAGTFAIAAVLGGLRWVVGRTARRADSSAVTDVGPVGQAGGATG